MKQLTRLFVLTTILFIFSNSTAQVNLLDLTDTTLLEKIIHPNLPDNITYFDETPDDVNGNLSVDFVSPNQNQYIIFFIDSQGNTISHNVQNNPNFSINLEDGIYDIVTLFKVGNQFKYVMKELVQIGANSHLTFDASESIHKVIFEVKNEQNQRLNIGVDCNFISGGLDFFHKASNRTGIISYFLVNNSGDVNDDPVWTFYINNLSDRYEVNFSSVYRKDYKTYHVPSFESIKNGINSSITRTNVYNDWITYKEKAIKLTTMGANNPDDKTCGIFASRIYNGKTNDFMFGVGTETYDDQPFIYKFNPNVNANHHIMFSTYISEINPMSFDRVLFGNAITAVDNNLMYADSYFGISLYTLGANLFRTEGSVQRMPLHEKFAFDTKNNPNIDQGNNVPINIFQLNHNGNLKSDFIGRFGEGINTLLNTSQIEVLKNDQMLFNGNLDNLSYSLVLFNEVETYKTKITHESIFVDDLQGKNVTEMYFKRVDGDYIPPTLQILQLRNGSTVKQKFNYDENISIRIAAGDFYMDENNNQFYKEGSTLQAFYSKHGQNQWVELNLTQDDNFFQMPKFGDYYEASLNGTIDDLNGWYDMKFILTDAVGNYQTQELSPVFYVGTDMDSQEINAQNEILIYPNPFGNEINVEIRQENLGSFTVQILDLFGKQIQQETRNEKKFKINTSHLPKGIYLLQIHQKGKIISHKVIKK